MNSKTIVLLIVSTILLLNKSYGQHAEEIFQRGNSLDWDGKYQEALMYVDSSLRMDSALYQRYLFRAELKVKVGMLESAITDVTKAIERCKHKLRSYHVSDYYLERCNLHILNNDSTSAFGDLNKSILTNPKNWKSRNLRSMFLINKSEFGKALIDLNKSIEIDDNQADSFILRGKLLLRMGETSRACSDFRTVNNWGFDEFESWIKKNCK